jgi:hypothetical protein
MPRWLAKAKNALGKSSPREPEPYLVTCVCGQTAEGLRIRGHQEVECVGCGELLFVLPTDAYPPPVIPKKRGKHRQRQKPPLVSTPPIVSTAAETADADDQMTASATVSPAAEKRESTGEPSRAVVTVGRSLRQSLMTPFRIVMLAMIVIVCLTTYWVLHVRALDLAASTALLSQEKADAALKTGDFAAAAIHYQNAYQALQTLGRNDALTQSTRRLAQETSAAGNLAMQPLLTILEEAHRELSTARTDDEKTEAERHSLDYYAGQWIVMETTLIRETDSHESSGWILDYPFAIDSTRVVINADLPVFQPLQSGKPPRRVIFAAQLDKCRWIEIPRPTLLLDLKHDTAFLWTSYDILRMVGLVGDEDRDAMSVRSLLKEQSRIVGIGQ